MVGLGYDGLVTERTMTRLEDLPALRVLEVAKADARELLGVFTHLKSVRAGRSWPYAGDADSLSGDLSSAPFWSPSSAIQAGTPPTRLWSGLPSRRLCAW